MSDEHVKRNLPTRNANMPQSRRQISELDIDAENPDSPLVDTSVDAIKNYSNKIQCWNCEEVGHHWEDCLQNRKIFCYGCGAKEIYKPNCTNCLAKRALASKKLRPPVPRVEP